MSKNATVLCVDDEPAVLLTLSLVLQSGGFNVLTAETAYDAIQLLTEQDVHLVLLDYGVSELERLLGV